MRQSAIALLDDKDLRALKAMMPHKKGHLTKARMEPIVDSSLDVLIPGSMSLLRAARARLTSRSGSAWRPAKRVYRLASSRRRLSSTNCSKRVTKNGYCAFSVSSPATSC